jgi:hypothetical protein
MPVEFEWLASPLGAVTVIVMIAIGLFWDRLVAARRLLAVLVAGLGGAQLAAVAVYGIGTKFAAKFPPAMLIFFRLTCSVVSVWALYMAFTTFRTWLRIGDEPEEDA